VIPHGLYLLTFIAAAVVAALVSTARFLRRGAVVPWASVQLPSKPFEGRPIPLGAGPCKIPGRSGPDVQSLERRDGCNAITLLPVEAFVLTEIGLYCDKPNRLHVTSVKIGRMELIESGAIVADAFGKGGPSTKIAAGATIYPTTGIRFTFTNPDVDPVDVSPMVMGKPVACPISSPGLTIADDIVAMAGTALVAAYALHSPGHILFAAAGLTAGLALVRAVDFARKAVNYSRSLVANWRARKKKA